MRGSVGACIVKRMRVRVRVQCRGLASVGVCEVRAWVSDFARERVGAVALEGGRMRGGKVRDRASEVMCACVRE